MSNQIDGVATHRGQAMNVVDIELPMFAVALRVLASVAQTLSGRPHPSNTGSCTSDHGDDSPTTVIFMKFVDGHMTDMRVETNEPRLKSMDHSRLAPRQSGED